jgi:protein N-terminal amidase
VCANSAVVYGPSGEWVAGYRKTNLFTTDKSWAIPGALPFPRCHSPHSSVTEISHKGTGFATLNLPPPLNSVTLAICMDLNPHPPRLWTLSDGPYEVADHVMKTGSHVLLLLNAWLDSQEDQDSEEDWQTLNYWAARLRPLWEKEDEEWKVGEASDITHRQHIMDKAVTSVIICNRTGEENGMWISFLYS